MAASADHAGAGDVDAGRYPAGALTTNQPKVLWWCGSRRVFREHRTRRGVAAESGSTERLRADHLAGRGTARTHRPPGWIDWFEVGEVGSGCGRGSQRRFSPGASPRSQGQSAHPVRAVGERPGHPTRFCGTGCGGGTFGGGEMDVVARWRQYRLLPCGGRPCCGVQRAVDAEAPSQYRRSRIRLFSKAFRRCRS